MRLKIRLSFFLVLALASVTACTETVGTGSLDDADRRAEREAIGTWLEDGPSGSRVTIYREDGLVFMEIVAGDGSSETAEMIETSLPRNTRFDYEDGRGGGYYLISINGDLKGWTPDGPFLTARPID